MRLSQVWWLPETSGNLSVCPSSLTFPLLFAFRGLGVTSSEKPLPSGLMTPGTSVDSPEPALLDCGCPCRAPGWVGRAEVPVSFSSVPLTPGIQTGPGPVLGKCLLGE